MTHNIIIHILPPVANVEFICCYAIVIFYTVIIIIEQEPIKRKNTPLNYGSYESSQCPYLVDAVKYFPFLGEYF